MIEFVFKVSYFMKSPSDTILCYNDMFQEASSLSFLQLINNYNSDYKNIVVKTKSVWLLIIVGGRLEVKTTHHNSRLTTD
jgi:hypothetical protein